MTVAIPGENTTAHMLFSLAFPEAKRKKFLLFSEIEGAVATGSVDAGVIIHENRFTYMHRGCEKIMDLGEYWEEVTQSPIPLGGIVARKSFDEDLLKKVNGLIRSSVEYSFSRYPEISEYVKQHAQEMEVDVMKKHIDLYVNDYTLDLGLEGEAAVNTLIQVYETLHASTLKSKSSASLFHR